MLVAILSQPGALAVAHVDLDITTILLLVFASALAGWIDAVVGGGGLIQLPALLLVPGMTPIQAVATNKIGSICGTTVSATTYLTKVKVDKSVTVPGAMFALMGAVMGALVASQIPEKAFTPIILVVLIGVGVFTLAKPSLGAEARLRFSGRPRMHHGVSWLIGLLVGMYDGALGPGTGSFLVIGLVAVVGFSFLQASASAKVMNWATNFGSLLFFVPAGFVVWKAGLAVAVGNVIGGFFGAKLAISKGSTFVRVVFVIVVSALVLKLGFDMIRETL